LPEVVSEFEMTFRKKNNYEQLLFSISNGSNTHTVNTKQRKKAWRNEQKLTSVISVIIQLIETSFRGKLALHCIQH